MKYQRLLQQIGEGAKSESHLFQQLSKLLEIKRIRTTPYRPMVSDMTERLRRQLEASLTTVLVSNYRANKLPLFKLGLTKTVKLDIGYCPAELVYGLLYVYREKFCFR